MSEPADPVADDAHAHTSGLGGRANGLWWILSVGVIVIVIDQVTKYLAIQSLEGEPKVQVVGEILQLTFVRNPGAAFSIGTQYTWLFSIAALLVSGLVLYFARRIVSGWWMLALGMLLGGALGNLIDRFTQPPGGGFGHVVDFLELPNWPVFNVADMSVVGAAILIVVLSLLGVEPTGKRPADSHEDEPATATTPEP
ncbi:MAG: signal peptidase II [Actinobacteria bacterium]|nr:signal peptidase II [Actinomycetota bacterium]